MATDEHKALEQAIEEITEIATGFGLDFFPMRYEICPADIIYTFGAYGMPTRFAHWSFGKSFHRMKLQYDLGLSKIYELVINSNPCYAFLLEGNSLIQNKLIVAHVLAHSDFFKNNVRFVHTNRNMVESMSAAAERIRAYELEHGRKQVEVFLDAVLAIQEHIDPSLMRPKRSLKKESVERGVGSGSAYLKYEGKMSRQRSKQKGKNDQGTALEKRKKDDKQDQKRMHRVTDAYDDLWALDEERQKEMEREKIASVQKKKKFPQDPEKDLLLFIEEHSPQLEEWQRDILTMLREEMLYFWPQLETKIMNEGWASYWHVRILREMELTEEESIEFARLNASVIAPSKTSINPYYLGYKMYEDIEKRWDDPSKEEREKYGRRPGEGRKKLFEVREMESDISFIRNYLTQELVEDLDLYLFQKKGREYTIVDKQWKNVRDQLVSMRVNGGFPYLVVENGDYMRQGELLLRHSYEGMELDIKYVEKTLPYVYQLWGKPVHLQSVIDEKQAMFSFDGKRVQRRFM